MTPDPLACSLKGHETDASSELLLVRRIHRSVDQKDGPLNLLTQFPGRNPWRGLLDA
jgi:hypothetical protein